MVDQRHGGQRHATDEGKLGVLRVFVWRRERESKDMAVVFWARGRGM